jgi:hypothetical protein
MNSIELASTLHQYGYQVEELYYKSITFQDKEDRSQGGEVVTKDEKVA